MQVRLLTTSASPNGVFHAGDVVVLYDSEAKALVKAGYAEIVDAGWFLSTVVGNEPELSVMPEGDLETAERSRKRK